MLLFQKICVIHRAVHFMKPDQARDFAVMLKAETDACEDDVDSRCVGLFIQAEAMRQSESWDEALRLSTECRELAPQLSAEGRKNGSLQFCVLVAAYAHFAKGRLGEAKEALEQLNALGSDHAWQREIEFKATHLRHVVGAQFHDEYVEVTVGARSMVRLVVEIPTGCESVEWDWVLSEYTVNFTSFLQRVDQGDAPPIELQREMQYRAEYGPCMGKCPEPVGPGRLELVFDNSFSLLRSKTVQCRVQPGSLRVVRDDPC